MAKNYENLTPEQKKIIEMRRRASNYDHTDAAFTVEKAKPQPPEGWKEQGQ